MSVRNIGAAQIKQLSLKGIGAAVATTSAISQYKSIGYNLSGASHACSNAKKENKQL